MKYFSSEDAGGPPALPGARPSSAARRHDRVFSPEDASVGPQEHRENRIRNSGPRALTIRLLKEPSQGELEPGQHVAAVKRAVVVDLGDIGRTTGECSG
jgi:hypothetical protein